ncbi:GH39 family glycosyl hydrolase [Butyrivibrio sp. AE3004]|uniref:GH39 family glycosyl hydrolase n=1 Tax=Butyrivibrio sp. AE3004 TaxID=1506994 RepID=UPI0004943A28|nr:helix-turn-helix domain-containing protein [Butyrivibrio sp. AE3004]
MSGITIDTVKYKYDHYEEGVQIHEDMEILYILSGRMAVFNDERNFVLGTEDFIVINPFERHEMYRDKGCHAFSLFIPLDILISYNVGQIGCCSTISGKNVSYYPAIRKHLAQVVRYLLQHSHEQNDMFAESNLLQFLAILKTYFPGESEVLKNRKDLAPILLFIHERYRNQISAQRVADHFHFSQGYFSKYFEKSIGKPFSVYIRDLRLLHARNLLMTSDKQIIDIAADSGFDNVNTFISNFRDKYGMTPAKYRKSGVQVVFDVDERNLLDEKNSRTQLYSLLRHASDSETGNTVNNQRNMEIVCDVNKDRIDTISESAFIMLNMGYAIGLMDKENQIAASEAIRKFGYKYIYVQGIFDEEMNVYNESPQGELSPRFRLLDQVIDFILEVGTMPWIELSRTPRELIDSPENEFYGGYVQLPTDLEKWSVFIESVLLHFIKRYGFECVNKWRMSIFPGLYISYGVFTLSEYLDYYEATYNEIRKNLPDIMICGGTFDVRLLLSSTSEKDRNLLTSFLKITKNKGILPDILGIQCFHSDFATTEISDAERLIVDEKRTKNPVLLTTDADSLSNDIESLKRIQEEADTEIPMAFVYWNSTMWNKDLGNDTCYKSAFLIKNVTENCNKLDTLSYSTYYDGETEQPLFGGNFCIMAAGRIPKPVYHALTFLKKIEGEDIISSGYGYMVTKNHITDDFHILLYNYCHYDPDLSLNEIIAREEQLTIDRYYAFEDKGPLNVSVTLEGMRPGKWLRENYIVSRSCGSSFDVWKEMGAPEFLTEAQREYIVGTSVPGYSMLHQHVLADIPATFYEILTPHEVRLISFTFEAE